MEKCIACFEDTLDRTKCCRVAVCKECHDEWLTIKRQCMHCKADQCDFDTWINEHRVEQAFEPQEYLHSLVQNEYTPEFGIQDIFTALQSIQHSFMEQPGDLPAPDEAFEFQYGFTVTPTDDDGNPTGAGITVANTIDYPGSNQQFYDNIQQSIQQYQQIFENNTENDEFDWP